MHDEQDLIRRAQKGELSAFEQLVKKYQKMILAHTLRLLKDMDKAKDAAQEAFVRAYENIRKFKLGRPFRPWIYKIATNICYDMIKKDSKVTRLKYEPVMESESYLDRMIRKEQVTRLVRAVKQLPDKYKEAIDGYYFKRLSYRELAFEMNIPINTVKTRLRRGKKMLRDELI